MERGLSYRQVARRLLLRAVSALPPAQAPRRCQGGPKRVLLIRPDHLGDVLFTTPALRALRQAWPQVHITYLVGEWARPAVANNPHVDDVLTCPFPGFTRQPKGYFLAPYRLLAAEARRLRARGFDLAIDLRFDFWWGALLAYAAGIPQRLGYDLPEGAPFLTTALPYQARRHEVEQNLALVAAATGEASEAGPLEFWLQEEDEAWARAWLGESPTRLVAIHPGSGAPVKLWRGQAFAQVGDGIESLQVLRSNVPEIERHLGNVANAGAERALPEEIAVQADHLVAGVEQHRHHYGADVALVSGDQDAH